MTVALRSLATAAVLCALGTVSAAAQDPDSVGSTLVFAASRYAQTPAEAPASVTVITRREIRWFGWRTIADVLAATQGLFASYDRNYTYLTVRGLARPGDFNTRILLMVNGHRLNGAVGDDGLVGTEGTIDIEAIERVEVIRGPGSSLYGTNALYGVVNIVTRQGRGPGTIEAEGAVASFETWHGSATAGGRSGSGLDVFATGSVTHSEGDDLYYPEFDDPATNDGRAVGVDGDRYERVFASVGYGDFRAQGSFSSRRKEIPTGSFETLFNDPRALTRDDVTLFALDFEHAFPNLSRLWTSASYTDNYYGGRYPYEEALLGDYMKASVWALEGQYLAFVAGRHKLSVGGEVRRQARLDQAVFDVSPSYSYLDDQRDAWVAAGFVQGEFRLTERAVLYAGLRHDWYETVGGTTNPRGGLVVSVGRGTSLKALYGRAFRAPSPYELYYNDQGFTQKPAGDLDPEVVQTFEVAADHAVTPFLRGTLSLYHMRTDQLIALVTDPVDSLLVFENIDQARTSGAELEVQGRVVGRLWARASYAYQHATEGDAGVTPVNSPRHVARLALSQPVFADRLRGSAEARYLSGRPTTQGGGADPYVVVDLTVLARPLARVPVEISASLYNLFAADYADPGGEEHLQDLLPRDGRTFRIGARVSTGGFPW